MTTVKMFQLLPMYSPPCLQEDDSKENKGYTLGRCREKRGYGIVEQQAQRILVKRDHCTALQAVQQTSMTPTNIFYWGKVRD